MSIGRGLKRKKNEDKSIGRIDMKKLLVLLAIVLGLLVGCSSMQRATDFYMGYEMRKPDGTIYVARPGNRDYLGCLREAKKETQSSWTGMSTSDLCANDEECRTAYDRCMKSRGYTIRGIYGDNLKYYQKEEK
jgi:hypothetical protein